MVFAERRFHWADYLVFCVSLGISVAIGFYYAFQARRKASTTEYLLGGRDMGVFPVAASLVVSLISAIFVQGVPAEVYSYGMYYAFAIFGYAFALIVSSLFYHPVYHRLGITSVYEYLELRFSKGMRIVCSVVTMIQMVLYSSVALYAPSIALSQATGLPYWACTVIAAALCTFYTTLGGFNTVLWTDTLQCGIMIIGLTATLIKGSIDLGGLPRAMDIAKEGGRLNLTKIVPHPLERHTIWNWVFGDFPFYMSMYAASQFAVQRFCSVKTINKARLAMLCAIPIDAVLVVLANILGLLAYAYYRGCDPYISGRIQSRDRTLALLVMDVFEHYPGMAGVFMSSILSAALSTLSSVQNSFAAILLEDVLKPLKLKLTKKPLSEKQATITSKATVFLVGVGIMCMAVVAARSGKLVMQLATAALTLGSAPVLGVFTLGLFMSFTNTRGAYVGLLGGILILGWIIIGALSIPKTLHPPLPLGTDMCSLKNTTFTGKLIHENTSAITQTFVNASGIGIAAMSSTKEDLGISRLYRVSYQWYAFIGWSSAVVFGVCASLLTGGWKTRKTVREDLLFSFRLHGLTCSIDQTCEKEMDSMKEYTPETEKMLNLPT